MGERGWSALLRLAPLEQLAPATRGDLDSLSAMVRANAAPRRAGRRPRKG